MASPPSLSTGSLLMASSLEQDARLILASAEISAARTLGAFQMVGQTMASVGNMVAKIYETKNATALEAWKLQEDQRRWDQNFALEQAKAGQDAQLTALQIEKTRWDTALARDNYKKQRAQEMGDRQLGPKFAMTTQDLQEDAAKGFLSYKDLKASEGMTIIDPETGQNLGIVSGDYLQGKMSGLFVPGSGAMTRQLQDRYNADGMTLKDAFAVVENPTSPDRDEALRLIAANSTKQSFDQMTTALGIGPGTAEYARLQDHIANPIPFRQDQAIKQAEVKYALSPTPENEQELYKARAAKDSTIAAANSINPAEQREIVLESLKTDSETFEDQRAKAAKGLFDTAPIGDRAKVAAASAVNPLLGGIVKFTEPVVRKWLKQQDTATKIAAYDHLGEQQVKRYLAGDPQAERQLDLIVDDMNKELAKTGGPQITKQYFAYHFIPKATGYLPGGYPKTVAGETPEWNRRFRDLFRVMPTSVAPLTPTLTVPTFATMEEAIAAGLPAGTKVSINGVTGTLK